MDFAIGLVDLLKSELRPDVHRGLTVRLSCEQAAELLSKGQVQQALRHRDTAAVLAAMGTNDPASQVHVKVFELKCAVHHSVLHWPCAQDLRG